MTDRVQIIKPDSYPSRKDLTGHQTRNMPERWKGQRLKFVAKTIAGQSPPSEIVGEFTGSCPFLQGNAEFGAIFPSPILSCESPNKSAEPGDILLSVRAPVGAINIADQSYGIGRGLCAIRAKPGIYQKFLYQSLTTTKETLKRASTGSTYDAVSIGDVGNIPTPIPPLAEQAAIVRYLDHADELISRYISAKERLIALLEEQRQAVIHQAVTRGLDPNVSLTPSGIPSLGDVPAHWDLRRAKFTYHESDQRSDSGVEELMSVSHITGVTPRKQNVTMFLAQSNEGYKLCRPGDIVVNTMWAYMAALGVARQSGLVSPSYGVYRPRVDGLVNPEYMDLLLRTENYRVEYTRRSKGITASRLRLYPDDFLDIPFLRPPTNEQTHIVKYLRRATANVDSTIDRTHRQIALMNEYRTRLIADVVTGQIDVRNATVELPD